MAYTSMSRRSLFAAGGGLVAGAGFFGPWRHNRVYAAATDKPVRIGITTDASGQYANSGTDERRGILMAIAEFNEKGGLNGRKIDTFHIDTETTPATGSRVAERMIAREQCAFLIGGVSSGVANAISQVAQKYGTPYMNTNSSAPTEAGKNCHRVKFVWDGNGTNFAMASVRNAIGAFGKRFLLLTNDYVWGHTTSAATRKIIAAYDAQVIEEIMVPQGTRDFSSILLKIQQAKPDVVAAAIGGDDQKAMRQQIAQLGMGSKPAWLNNQQDWPDVYGLPLDNLFGAFCTTWYWKLNLPGVAEFVQRYQAMYPETAMRVPGNVFYNGYMATRELLRAAERAGSTNNLKIIRELEGRKMPAAERLQHHDAVIDAKSHQVQQTIYLATANTGTKDPDDMFKIISNVAPDAVVDTESIGECQLESLEATPSYEV